MEKVEQIFPISNSAKQITTKSTYTQLRSLYGKNERKRFGL